MAFNLNKHHDDFLFLPLGGSGEIGMNFNLYHYKGKWLIIDCGAGFAEDDMPGIDMLVPDSSFIEQYKDDIVGMVLTHAHEDHVGAVQYIWRALECPVYTTPFTASFLKAKLVETGLANEVPIHEVPSNGKLELAPFSLELAHITHSAPEMNGMVVRTEQGAVMHTGDWKFDPEPLIEDATDLERLKSFGDQGILAMVGDSTNIFKEGTSGSEGELRKSLTKIMGELNQLIVVATFASNVARLETIAEAAKANGRKIAVIGRSINRIILAARESGYLQDVDFISDKEIGKHPKDKLVVLATGCQGEPLAATNKLANGSHPALRLTPGDSVIFSSKIIPGNDKRIYRLFNKLVKKQIEVITERDHFVHVSGHPARDEVRKMYELIRPKIAIPVHGEAVHIHEHAKLAREMGVEKAIEVENGHIIKLAPGEPEVLSVVQAGHIGIDGYYLQPPDGNVIRMRRKMAMAGIIFLVLLLDDRDELISDPIITAPGCLDPDEDIEVIEAMQAAVAQAVEQSKTEIKPKKKGKRPVLQGSQRLEQLVRTAVRQIIKRELGKSPTIEVQLEWLQAE